MNVKAINDMIVEIIEHKLALGTLTYDNPKYDKLEDSLHDLEDEFLDMYGDTFEEILDEIHEKLAADNEVLLPIAYMANSYQIAVDDKGNKTYDVKAGDGIHIDTDKFAGKVKSLVLVPSPLRFVLLVDNKKEVVWPTK
jgi:hypothetical protein